MIKKFFQEYLESLSFTSCVANLEMIKRVVAEGFTHTSATQNESEGLTREAEEP